MRIRTAAAATALSASLALAGAGAAAAQEAPAGEPDGPRITFVCEHEDLIAAAIDAAQAAVDARLELLAAARTDAESTGREGALARIERRIQRVEGHRDRLAQREARLAEVVAEHCPAA